MEYCLQEQLVFVKLLGRNYTEFGKRCGVNYYYNIILVFMIFHFSEIFPSYVILLHASAMSVLTLMLDEERILTS